MSHIFISYSKKNKDYTDKLVNFLEKVGFNVWYDGRIDYGIRWERVIFKAIDDCAVFLVVMTPESYDSDWVRKEYLYADKRKKPQFPILLAGEEFPFYVDHQYTDVRGGKLPPKDFVTRLSQAIKPQTQSGKNITPPEMITSQPEKPRFKLPNPFEWVEVPAGKVTIAKYGEFDVPTFSLAKYPITVAQYQVFMNDKGYEIEKYWTAPGWAWRQQEKITQPRFWGEKGYEHFFKPNHPIIGVSWYEAIAFCRWLSEKTGETILLPTEQEWQRAAQGDTGWAYPWGNQWDDKRSNSRVKSQSYGTTPVTQYPTGASPYGIVDMSGNVWEWTLSEYESASIGDINSTDVRVLRGGSWGYNFEDFLRVGFRLRLNPDIGSSYFGFRPARST